MSATLKTATETPKKPASEKWDVAWRGFAPGTWQSRVDVREFIQRNYTPYEGDGGFLQGATARTRGHVGDAAAAARDRSARKASSTCRRFHLGFSRMSPATSTRSTRSSSVCRPRHRSSARSCRSAAGASSQRASSPTVTSLTRPSARSSPSTARRTTTAYSTPTRRTSGMRDRRAL